MTDKTNTASPVIFDMDGVIVDSEPLHHEVENKIFTEMGLDISTEELNSFVGMVPLQIWSIICERYQLAEAPASLKAQEQNRKYDFFRRRHIPMVPGVEVLLKRLQRNGHPLALASSSPRRIIELFTAKTNTQSYFEFLLSGEEVDKGKPAPDIFLEAARRLEADPPTCFVIEDSANGVRAAKAAGMRCIGFQNPLSGAQDLAPADLVVRHFAKERETILRFVNGRVSY